MAKQKSDDSIKKKRGAVTINMDKELHLQLKMLSVELQTTIGELIEEATRNILKKHNKL